jgi:uncharacterized protein YdbL (DUF1318 family)
MSRYFFHVIDERTANLVRDSAGASFATVDEAKKEAIGFARDIVGHKLYGSTWRVVATNDNGQQILTVALAEIRPLKIRNWLGLIRRIVTYEPRLRPYILTGLLTAALFATIMQAAMLTGRVGELGSGYKMALSPREGLIVRVRFVSHASVADVSKFLDRYKASLVRSPQSAGVYQLQLSDISLKQAEIERIVDHITREKIIASASAAQ